MREWLSGRASPCQGERREFESRLPLQKTHEPRVSLFFPRLRRTCSIFLLYAVRVSAGFLKIRAGRRNGNFYCDTEIFIMITHIFKLARRNWGGYLFLLIVYWPIFFSIAFDFPKIFTVIMSLGYFCGTYSLGWQAGKSDIQQSGVYSIISAFWGGLFGIIISVVSLIFIIIGTITGISGGIVGFFWNIYTFLHFHFVYFLTNYHYNLLVYIVPVVLVLLLYPLGYYFGARKFSLIDKYFPKIFYKKSN